jgi:hypothetical protein
MHRQRSRLVGALIAATLALLLPAQVIGSDSLNAGSMRDRAALAPLPAFAPRPFAITTGAIRTLRWPDLPMNGLHLLKLKVVAGSDAQGITFKVIDGRRVYSPGNLASDGLRYLDGYVRTRNPAYLDRALVRARKLLSLSSVRGGARYYPYDYDYSGEGLRAPWYSAYSQGFALSLLVRLYRVTGDQAFADRARETALSFRRLGTSARPWVAYVRSDRLWLEEYPSATPTHVLNGFNFALFGLYDYERLTRDPTATDLLRGALQTMRSYAARYRVPGGVSLYDLVHRTQLPHYHAVAIWQLRDLTAISGDPWYAHLADLFEADHPGAP